MRNQRLILNGLFKASPRFAGNAVITARLGGISGRYNEQLGDEVNKSGQKVMYLVPATNDTISNGVGCALAIPAGFFAAGKQPLLGIDQSPPGGNKIKMITSGFDRITDAFDIKEESGAAIDSTSDSTRTVGITLTMPAEFVDDARATPEQFSVGLWDPDSLRWKVLTNSEVASDGMSVVAQTKHFSEYALLREIKDASATFRISPNPFSPYVTPKIEYGASAHPGTCFEIRASSKYNASDINIGIYTYDGTMVASAVKKNASSSQMYSVWWDGRTTSKTVMLDLEPLRIADGGSEGQMCRNGRYFVVVTVTDNTEEVRYRKELILIK